MTKFDLDTLIPLYKSIFDHWLNASKTDTNMGSNGDGSSFEVPRTAYLWESRPVPYPLGNMESINFNKNIKTNIMDLDSSLKHN